MFSKIEKTGSSTLYGMFQRFVKMNKLNLMVQTQGYHMNTSAPRGAHPGYYYISHDFLIQIEDILEPARLRETMSPTGSFINIR